MSEPLLLLVENSLQIAWDFLQRRSAEYTPDLSVPATDIYGDGVNVAARLETIAAGGNLRLIGGS
jgi:class 3 adenylate cyclase